MAKILLYGAAFKLRARLSAVIPARGSLSSGVASLLQLVMFDRSEPTSIGPARHPQNDSVFSASNMHHR